MQRNFQFLIVLIFSSVMMTGCYSHYKGAVTNPSSAYSGPCQATSYWVGDDVPSITTYTYLNDQLIKERTFFPEDNGEGIMLYHYREDGREDWHEAWNEGSFMYRVISIYDENNKVIRREYVDESGEEKSIVELKYNENGQLRSEQMHVVDDEKEPYTGALITHEYNALGQRIMTKENGKTKYYVYDAKGNLVVTYIKRSNGELFFITIYTYECWEKGEGSKYY